MFTPKLLVLIGCLMAVATVQSDTREITGDERTKEITQLQLSLDKLAAKTYTPKYTFNPDDVSKVAPSPFEGKQVVYTLKLSKDGGMPKDSTVYLTLTNKFDNIIVKTDGEQDFSDTV